jgi:ATP synthase H subunit
MEKKIPDDEAIGALERIKEAEEKAREIIQEAQEITAIQIVQDAHGKAEKIRARFLEEARKKAEEKKKEIIDRAKKERDKIEKDSEREISDLVEKTRSRMSDAVKIIGKKVEESLKKGAF